jgi:hypothetical protein
VIGSGNLQLTSQDGIRVKIDSIGGVDPVLHIIDICCNLSVYSIFKTPVLWPVAYLAQSPIIPAEGTK